MGKGGKGKAAGRKIVWLLFETLICAGCLAFAYFQITEANAPTTTIDATVSAKWTETEIEEPDEHWIRFATEDGTTFKATFPKDEWDRADAGQALTAERTDDGAIRSITGDGYDSKKAGPWFGWLVGAFGVVWGLIFLVRFGLSFVAGEDRS